MFKTRLLPKVALRPTENGEMALGKGFEPQFTSKAMDESQRDTLVI
jgi:hypothetical protein